MKSKANAVTDVDSYIASQPENLIPRLQQLRQIIKKAAPEADEVISYRMPAYKYYGMLVFFAGYKNHIGFYPVSSAVKAFKNELTRYPTSKGTIQFPNDKPLPLGLIRKIVKFRVKENMDKAIAKKNNKTAAVPVKSKKHSKVKLR